MCDEVHALEAHAMENLVYFVIVAIIEVGVHMFW